MLTLQQCIIISFRFNDLYNKGYTSVKYKAFAHSKHTTHCLINRVEVSEIVQLRI